MRFQLVFTHTERALSKPIQERILQTIGVLNQISEYIRGEKEFKFQQGKMLFRKGRYEHYLSTDD